MVAVTVAVLVPVMETTVVAPYPTTREPRPSPSLSREASATNLQCQGMSGWSGQDLRNDHASGGSGFSLHCWRWRWCGGGDGKGMVVEGGVEGEVEGEVVVVVVVVLLLLVLVLALALLVLVLVPLVPLVLVLLLVLLGRWRGQKRKEEKSCRGWGFQEFC
ncbi:hypothetical protein QBC39DRAFT_62950 [Podospora conica]|nr:hypothetical protein QBC39DRAFT_62950 [Schizothecium conicum]